ncbi:MAG: peptidoglycan DD-metalloendopeptidase family protein, partial [Methylophaga sp.]|nr:peptidoglycan DD-metalloendopeptidase family protein [Methylophaga sp.]
LTTITNNNLIKTANIEAKINWQDITVKSGDNLSLIFPRVGLSARDVYNVAKLGKDIKPLLNLKPGQVIRFNINKEDGNKRLQQLQLKLSPIKTFSVTSINDSYQAELQTRDVEQRQMHASAQIESSLFGAGIEAGLSDKLIMELAYIFGWDIDFALDLRKGDNFTLIYSEDYLDGDKVADGAILAAEFTNQGKIFRAVRYTDSNGRSQYYSPKGDSMRKAFSRTPVHFSRISSRFNPNRKHPVLKTSRPHRGVDYAAARGTPILATGDGKISFRGTKGGYGRTVVLTHGGKYTTLYAHMSKFKKGLRNGSRVKQGQTIGYIGSSGLATGPHLHYEFRVNGVHRNPLTVSLPKAEALAKKYRSDFKLKSQPLLAQLDSLKNTNLALND